MQAKIIKELRKQIPTFQCRKGCIDCCGPIIFNRWEWEQVEDKRIATSLTCPYAKPGVGCEIYEHRPIICRLYGASEDLPCPHGCKPERVLTAKEADLIMKTYLSTFQPFAKEEE